MNKKLFIFYMAFAVSSFANQVDNLKVKPIESHKLTTEKPTNIFVHGTLFSPFAWLVHWLDCPLGLCHAQVQGNKFVMGKIPYILNSVSPQLYPLDNFFLFGWSGKLSFDSRKEDARHFYQSIKNLKGPKVVIAHSHGCNLVLNSAKVAEEHSDKDFVIDKLILLAPPVQQVTASLISSKVFKKVISLYSVADLTQVMDPQGLYPETKSLGFNKLFSERIFDPSPNLVQAQVLINGQHPGHLDFILEGFLKHVPEILQFLERIELDPKLKNKDGYYIINSSFNDTPVLVSKDKLQKYSPRCRGFHN